LGRRAGAAKARRGAAPDQAEAELETGERLAAWRLARPEEAKKGAEKERGSIRSDHRPRNTTTFHKAKLTKYFHRATATETVCQDSKLVPAASREAMYT